MDISTLFSIQNILQAAGVGIVIFIVRTLLQLKFVSLTKSKVFTGVVLPSSALLLSLAASYVRVSPFTVEAAFNGILCGFASSYVFSILKTFLNKEAGNPDLGA